MGLRGPKPVDRESLEFRALQFSNLLFTLRDGQGARIGAAGPHGSIDVSPVNWNSKQTQEFIERMRAVTGIPYGVVARIPPNPRAWGQLKRAQTERQVRRAADSIKRWAQTVDRSDWRSDFPRVINDSAKEVLRAKKSWNYPRDETGNRPKSDDKRIIFFGKVLAGLAFGLSPAYSTKVLASWPWTKDWIQGPFVAMEKGFGGRIVHFGKKRSRR